MTRRIGRRPDARLGPAFAVGALLLAACPSPTGTTGSLDGRLVFAGAASLAAAGIDVTPHLAEADIEIDGPSLDRAILGADGAFAATGLAPGSYTVRASVGIFSRELGASATVEVVAGVAVTVPDLVLTPAGSLSGRVEVTDGSSAEGFRLQLVNTTDRTAVADAEGRFVIHRVPFGAYELIAERADIGSARRAGIEVTPFSTLDIGALRVEPGGNAQANHHPVIDPSGIILIANATPTDEPLVPLPYRTAPGTARRFDRVGLAVSATDPDGDVLTYEWSASAGQLDGALGDEPLWHPEATSGSVATVSVTLRDGHGGFARTSLDVEIVDVYAGTAHAAAGAAGPTVVHSYRVEGGPWRIDVVDLSTGVVTPVAENPGADPRPLLAGAHVIYRKDFSVWAQPIGGGDPQNLGIAPAQDSVDKPSVVSTGTDLFFIRADNGSMVSRRSFANGVGAETTAHTCNGLCEQLTVSRDEVAVLSGAQLNLFPAAGGTANPATASAPIGRGLALAGGRVAFVSGDSGRSMRNAVGGTASGEPWEVLYAGYYDLLVWARLGDAVFITEQEYLSLRHPPFVRWIEAGADLGRYPADADRDWMADRAFPLDDDRLLIRRLTSADWPESFEVSRSEIVIVRPAEVFE